MYNYRRIGEDAIQWRLLLHHSKYGKCWEWCSYLQNKVSEWKVCFITCKLEHSCYNKLYFTFSDLDINIVDNGDGTVSIYYTVEDAGEYTINVKFGGQTVPGGFYTFMVSVHLLQYKKKFCNEALQFNATMSSFVRFSKCTRMTSQTLDCCHNVDCRE